MPWKRTASKDSKKKNIGRSTSQSDTEVEVNKRTKNKKEDYVEVVLPSTKPVTTKTSVAAAQKKVTTPQADKKVKKTKVAKTPDVNRKLSNSEPKSPKKAVRSTKSSDHNKTESKQEHIEPTPGRTKKLSKKEKKEQSSSLPSVVRKPTKEDTEVLTPIIDCKTLEKDELLSILRSANEITPVCLKVNIINNYTPQKGKEGSELIVRKGDIVYLLYVLDGNCLVKNKKGKSGFIPFSSTSSSIALIDSTPKTQRRLFGNKQQKKALSEERRRTSVDEKPLEKPVRKQRSISFDLPPEKPRNTGVVEPPDTAVTRTESGSPTITKRAPVHYFAEGTSNEHKAFVASGRSKSYDQILKPLSAIGIKKRNRKEKDDLVAPLRQTKTRASSVNASDEFDFQRPSTALDRYRASSFETADPADLQRPATALGGRRLSNSSTSGFSETSRGSIERILSPITQRKLKHFSNSEKDMNKLKAFSRKITSKGSLKDKNTRKTSSSSRMSDSELSSSSYSSSIVKVNNKRNGGKHQRVNSLSDNYQVNWYKDWNIEPSDSSDSEDESCNTTDTESIQLKVKKVTNEERSLSDYETRTGTNRLRYRRTSNISASSDMYIPKQKQAMAPRETNNNERTSNLSGFAQVYKTKTAIQKNKSSSSDALLDGSTKRDLDMEERIKELKKNRLSNSNSSLSSIHKTSKPLTKENNDNGKLLSPLVPQKVSCDNTQSVSDILLGKSVEENNVNNVEKQEHFVEKQANFVEKVKNIEPDNVMIVKSDFIAQEADYVTILTCQHVTVLDRSDNEWWWVKTPSGDEGFVPKDFLMEKPKIPRRKPDANTIKRISSPTENDLNNNSGILRKTNKSTTSNQQPTPLAKVAPLMRADAPQDPKKNFSLYKKPIPTRNESPPLPSYNQLMMRRQKSDLTDRYYNNNGDYSDNEKVRRTADPGGAARVVRRRSFSGRQKKVRFANDVASGDESGGPRYQNSPGQILVVRQPSAGGTAHVEFGKDGGNEIEIATWC